MLAPLFLLPAVLVGPVTDVPQPKPEDLAAQLDLLRSPVAAERIAAARAIATAPPSGVAVYIERLRRPRPVGADVLRKLVLETWAQVPDPNYGKTGNLWVQKPEPSWKPGPTKRGARRPHRPPPHDPDVVQWMEALNELDLDENPALKAIPDRVEARAEAMEAVALLKAISAAGKRGDLTSFDPMFDFAFDLDGVFRDECGRAIRAMDSQAIPGLIARMRATGKGLALFRMKRYASYQLDRMDRAQPAKAISTAPDDRIRAAIIHAYGEVRALDAVDAILAQVDASSRRVRQEARWSWLRYVTGPPPPDAPKRKRKLPGGKAESAEKEDYLNYREMAILALNRELKSILGGDGCYSCASVDADGKPAPRTDPKKMTDELLAFYDRRRAAEWDAEWAHAQGRVKAGDLARAVDEFQLILARDPLYGRRAEMADTFYSYGDSLIESEPARGAAMLREAIALDPSSPRAAATEATLNELDGEDRQRRGTPDEEQLRRALALEAGRSDARVKLRLIDLGDRHKRLVERSVMGAAAIAAAAILLSLILFIARRRPTDE